MEKTAIIIDDDNLSISLLKITINSIGIEIKGIANDATTGLELASEMQPTIVFLDINLPQKSGVEVIEDLLKACPESKIIMISGEASRTLFEKSMELGADSYLSKPFNINEIKARVNDVLTLPEEKAF